MIERVSEEIIHRSVVAADPEKLYEETKNLEEAEIVERLRKVDEKTRKGYFDFAKRPKKVTLKKYKTDDIASLIYYSNTNGRYNLYGGHLEGGVNIEKQEFNKAIEENNYKGKGITKDGVRCSVIFYEILEVAKEKCDESNVIILNRIQKSIKEGRAIEKTDIERLSEILSKSKIINEKFSREQINIMSQTNKNTNVKITEGMRELGDNVGNYLEYKKKMSSKQKGANEISYDQEAIRKAGRTVDRANRDEVGYCAKSYDNLNKKSSDGFKEATSIIERENSKLKEYAAGRFEGVIDEKTNYTQISGGEVYEVTNKVFKAVTKKAEVSNKILEFNENYNTENQNIKTASDSLNTRQNNISSELKKFEEINRNKYNNDYDAVEKYGAINLEKGLENLEEKLQKGTLTLEEVENANRNYFYYLKEKEQESARISSQIENKQKDIGIKKNNLNFQIEAINNSGNIDKLQNNLENARVPEIKPSEITFDTDIISYDRILALQKKLIEQKKQEEERLKQEKQKQEQKKQDDLLIKAYNRTYKTATSKEGTATSIKRNKDGTVQFFDERNKPVHLRLTFKGKDGEIGELKDRGDNVINNTNTLLDEYEKTFETINSPEKLEEIQSKGNNVIKNLRYNMAGYRYEVEKNERLRGEYEKTCEDEAKKYRAQVNEFSEEKMKETLENEAKKFMNDENLKSEVNNVSEEELKNKIQQLKEQTEKRAEELEEKRQEYIRKQVENIDDQKKNFIKKYNEDSNTVLKKTGELFDGIVKGSGDAKEKIETATKKLKEQTTELQGVKKPKISYKIDEFEPNLTKKQERDLAKLQLLEGRLEKKQKKEETEKAEKESSLLAAYNKLDSQLGRQNQATRVKIENGKPIFYKKNTKTKEDEKITLRVDSKNETVKNNINNSLSNFVQGLAGKTKEELDDIAKNGDSRLDNLRGANEKFNGELSKFNNETTVKNSKGKDVAVKINEEKLGEYNRVKKDRMREAEENITRRFDIFDNQIENAKKEASKMEETKVILEGEEKDIEKLNEKQKLEAQEEVDKKIKEMEETFAKQRTDYKQGIENQIEQNYNNGLINYNNEVNEAISNVEKGTENKSLEEQTTALNNGVEELGSKKPSMEAAKYGELNVSKEGLKEYKKLLATRQAIGKSIEQDKREEQDLSARKLESHKNMLKKAANIGENDTIEKDENGKEHFYKINKETGEKETVAGLDFSNTSSRRQTLEGSDLTNVLNEYTQITEKANQYILQAKDETALDEFDRVINDENNGIKAVADSICNTRDRIIQYNTEKANVEEWKKETQGIINIEQQKLNTLKKQIDSEEEITLTDEEKNTVIEGDLEKELAKLDQEEEAIKKEIASRIEYLDNKQIKFREEQNRVNGLLDNKEKVIKDLQNTNFNQNEKFNENSLENFNKPLVEFNNKMKGEINPNLNIDLVNFEDKSESKVAQDSISKGSEVGPTKDPKVNPGQPEEDLSEKIKKIKKRKKLIKEKQRKEEQKDHNQLLLEARNAEVKRGGREGFEIAVEVEVTTEEDGSKKAEFTFENGEKSNYSITAWKKTYYEENGIEGEVSSKFFSVSENYQQHMANFDDEHLQNIKEGKEGCTQLSDQIQTYTRFSNEFKETTATLAKNEQWKKEQKRNFEEKVNDAVNEAKQNVEKEANELLDKLNRLKEGEVLTVSEENGITQEMVGAFNKMERETDLTKVDEEVKRLEEQLAEEEDVIYKKVEEKCNAFNDEVDKKAKQYETDIQTTKENVNNSTKANNSGDPKEEIEKQTKILQKATEDFQEARKNREISTKDMNAKISDLNVADLSSLRLQLVMAQHRQNQLQKEQEEKQNKEKERENTRVRIRNGMNDILNEKSGSLAEEEKTGKADTIGVNKDGKKIYLDDNGQSIKLTKLSTKVDERLVNAVKNVNNIRLRIKNTALSDETNDAELNYLEGLVSGENSKFEQMVTKTDKVHSDYRTFDEKVKTAKRELKKKRNRVNSLKIDDFSKTDNKDAEGKENDEMLNLNLDELRKKQEELKKQEDEFKRQFEEEKNNILTKIDEKERENEKCEEAVENATKEVNRDVRKVSGSRSIDGVSTKTNVADIEGQIDGQNDALDKLSNALKANINSDVPEMEEFDEIRENYVKNKHEQEKINLLINTKEAEEALNIDEEVKAVANAKTEEEVKEANKKLTDKLNLIHREEKLEKPKDSETQEEKQDRLVKKEERDNQLFERAFGKLNSKGIENFARNKETTTEKGTRGGDINSLRNEENQRLLSKNRNNGSLKNAGKGAAITDLSQGYRTNIEQERNTTGVTYDCEDMGKDENGNTRTIFTVADSVNDLNNEFVGWSFEKTSENLVNDIHTWRNHGMGEPGRVYDSKGNEVSKDSLEYRRFYTMINTVMDQERYKEAKQNKEQYQEQLQARQQTQQQSRGISQGEPLGAPKTSTETTQQQDSRSQNSPQAQNFNNEENLTIIEELIKKIKELKQKIEQLTKDVGVIRDKIQNLNINNLAENSKDESLAANNKTISQENVLNKGSKNDGKNIDTTIYNKGAEEGTISIGSKAKEGEEINMNSNNSLGKTDNSKKTIEGKQRSSIGTQTEKTTQPKKRGKNGKKENNPFKLSINKLRKEIEELEKEVEELRQKIEELRQILENSIEDDKSKEKGQKNGVENNQKEGKRQKNEAENSQKEGKGQSIENTKEKGQKNGVENNQKEGKEQGVENTEKAKDGTGINGQNEDTLTIDDNGKKTIFKGPEAEKVRQVLLNSGCGALGGIVTGNSAIQTVSKKGPEQGIGQGTEQSKDPKGLPDPNNNGQGQRTLTFMS